ncbi:hypothetical protein OPT61_g6545 [Boeremia exigua]|uniref:Uncharacterized protein n=1 Tax=Boeremia exigua TaxID=749465 RepID=A0ACC2I617_9PLEO|nr:hypothetical protein OPT61_g6545 [Boeremia exigua]
MIGLKVHNPQPLRYYTRTALILSELSFIKNNLASSTRVLRLSARGVHAYPRCAQFEEWGSVSNSVYNLDFQSGDRFPALSELALEHDEFFLTEENCSSWARATSWEQLQRLDLNKGAPLNFLASPTNRATNLKYLRFYINSPTPNLDDLTRALRALLQNLHGSLRSLTVSHSGSRGYSGPIYSTPGMLNLELEHYMELLQMAPGLEHLDARIGEDTVLGNWKDEDCYADAGEKWKKTENKIQSKPKDHVENNVEYTPFLECRKYFAVDDSGSTAGAVLRQERTFVDTFRESYPNTADTMSLWGTQCDNPTTQFESVQWLSNHWGTSPSRILKNSAAVKAIKESDVWFLLTDGEIPDNDVHSLADLACGAEVLNVPLVFLITGSCGSSPGTANISVGISFFASSQDTLILFKDVSTGKIYVIAGKGCFAELGGSTAAHNLDSWDDLTAFTSEADFYLHCQKSHIKVAKSETRAKSIGGIGLGAAWEEQHAAPVRVDLDLLLGSGILSDEDMTSLLADEAFNALAIACKTRSRIPELRTFLQAHKSEMEVPKFEDRNGAAAIIASMADTATSDLDRKSLQEQLREAHVGNRRDYLRIVAEFDGSAAVQTKKRRNQLVDAALQSLASIQAASYSADILDRRSNRARRAQGIDSTPTMGMATLDLEAPSCKGYCLVCCGEEEIMAICFKEAAPEHAEDNTCDFALNFPLAAGGSETNVNLISSQNVCFQCALLAPNGMSIYKERLTAVVPAIQYDGNNRKYINNQLYAALTARLATGGAGVAQLFMAILLKLMKTKSWAGASMDSSSVASDEQHEAVQRRTTFQWMLDQLVQNTFTRENFKENGQWVKFPQALEWVVRDFDLNGFASFAVTYPVAGFSNLVALGQHTGVFSSDTISRLQSTKSLYSIIGKYLAEMQVNLASRPGDKSTTREHWKQKYLELIYRDFNATSTNSSSAYHHS